MDSYGYAAHKENDIEFYDPYLLKYGLYYNKSYIHLLTADILYHVRRTKYIFKYYYKESSNIFPCFFWNNHPLNKISVLGYVISWKLKWIGCQEYIIFSIDDTSSNESGEFLNCKCSKETLLRSNVTIKDHTTDRFRLVGTLNLEYMELNIEYIEYAGTLHDEIVHWELAVEQRTLLNDPWIIDKSFMETILIEQQDDDYLLKNQFQRTPSKNGNMVRNYIRNLQMEVLRDELEITSPYTESDGYLYTDFSLDPNDLDDIKKHLMVDLDSLDEREPLDPIIAPSVSLSDMKQIRRHFLQLLLNESDCQINITKIDNYLDLNKFIIDVCNFGFQNQNSLALKSFEELKEEKLSDLFQTVERAGLLQFISTIIVDITCLHKLYEYCYRRLIGLIKLRCYVGTIDHERIKEQLNLNNVSRKAILSIFKEAINNIISQYPLLIKSWWIDINNDRASLINLQYYSHNSNHIIS